MPATAFFSTNFTCFRHKSNIFLSENASHRHNHGFYIEHGKSSNSTRSLTARKEFSTRGNQKHTTEESSNSQKETCKPTTWSWRSNPHPDRFLEINCGKTHQIPSKIHTIFSGFIVVQLNRHHIASAMPCGTIQPTHSVNSTPVRSNPAKPTSSTRLSSGTMSVHPAEILWHQMLFNQPTLSTRHACGSPNKTHFVNETLWYNKPNSTASTRHCGTTIAHPVQILWRQPLFKSKPTSSPRHCGTQLNSTSNFRSTSMQYLSNIFVTSRRQINAIRNREESTVGVPPLHTTSFPLAVTNPSSHKYIYTH